MDLFVLCVVVFMIAMSSIVCILGLVEMLNKYGTDERANFLGCIGLSLFSGAILLCIFYTSAKTSSVELFIAPAFFGLGAVFFGASWLKERRARITSEELS